MGILLSSQDLFQKSFYPDPYFLEEHADRISGQDKARIQAVAPLIYTVFFAVSDKADHLSVDVAVPYAALRVYAVISEDHILIRKHLNDPVKDILILSPCEKHYIAFLISVPVIFLDGEQIFSLPEKRHHAHADIGIGDSTVFF